PAVLGSTGTADCFVQKRGTIKGRNLYGLAAEMRPNRLENAFGNAGHITEYGSARSVSPAVGDSGGAVDCFLVSNVSGNVFHLIINKGLYPWSCPHLPAEYNRPEILLHYPQEMF